MNVLELIASETNGKSYQSLKFCHDDFLRDASTYEKQEITCKQIGETEHFKETKSLKAYADKVLKNQPLFRYFLDGARRTYKIDEIAYNKRIYPILAGQIGVGCCVRLSADNFKVQKLEHKLVVCLPYIADKDGQRDKFFVALADKVNNHPKLKKTGQQFDDFLYYKSTTETAKYEDLGIARIQDQMIDLEKKIVANLTIDNLLNEDSYLIKDGSLEYQKMKTGDYKDLSIIKSNYTRVVGVSKRFDPEMCVDRHGKSNAEKGFF
jgi:hypothetical protein